MRTLILFCRAGIIGLYTAFILSQQDRGHDITIIAEYLPGDQSVDYTSPWAGGNFSTVSADTPLAQHHDKLTYLGLQEMVDLFSNGQGGNGELGTGVERMGLQKLKATEYYEAREDAPSQAKLDNMKSFIPDLREVPKDQLPKDKVYGITFTTWNFYCPKFLVFLKDYLGSRGVTFIRHNRLEHIDEAFKVSSAGTTKVVFNCTGLGARTLGGVCDSSVYSTRGQVVIVRAPHVNENMSVDGSVFTTYIIPRPHSGGLVVCGGYMQAHNYNGGSTYGYQSASILDRVKRLMPGIEPFEVVREAAGLRPSRVGGVRIERENREDGKVIVHNYGAGGTGYQSGYGMAFDGVALIQDVLRRGDTKL